MRRENWCIAFTDHEAELARQATFAPWLVADDSIVKASIWVLKRPRPSVEVMAQLYRAK